MDSTFVGVCLEILILYIILLFFSSLFLILSMIHKHPFQSSQLDHFYTNKKVIKFLSRLLQKQLPCTIELHFK